MRKPLVVGNWKMNFGRSEAASVARAIRDAAGPNPPAEVGICAPYLALALVQDALAGSDVFTGAEDAFWVDAGAFTGRISAAMLAEAGIRTCLVGHSETRGRFGKLDIPESTVGYFAETDETVNLKIAALDRHGIRTILCVGETLAEREAGQTDSVIQAQIATALKGVEFTEGVVAYEPVWAIGTGRTCDAVEANRVCGVVRAALAAAIGADRAAVTRVLYGGSVKAANASELFAQPEIDGGLVGGASMDAAEFAAIILSA